jgi:ABC-type uncharacterized transport system auxiliary subunit
MRTALHRLLVPAAALLLAGCLLPGSNRREVVQLDLGEPAFAALAPTPRHTWDVQIAPVANLCEARTKLVVRRGPSTIAESEYDRWAQAPEVLLTRRLFLAARASNLWPRVAAPDAQSPAVHRLSGTLLRFEQTADHQMRCDLELTLTDLAGNRTLFSQLYRETEPLSGPRAEDVAQAMATAVDRLLGRGLADMAALSAAAH